MEAREYKICTAQIVDTVPFPDWENVESYPNETSGALEPLTNYLFQASGWALEAITDVASGQVKTRAQTFFIMSIADGEGLFKAWRFTRVEVCICLLSGALVPRIEISIERIGTDDGTTGIPARA